jgi:murein DD-endopeptidase MepM/ murein hydrolase activator NlpD
MKASGAMGKKLLPGIILLLFFLSAGISGRSGMDKDETGKEAAGEEPFVSIAGEWNDRAAGIETAEGSAFQYIPAGLVQDEALPPPPPLRTTAIPGDPRPGEPVTVAFIPPAAGNFRAVLCNSRGQRLTMALFFPLPGGEELLWAAVLAVPSTARPEIAVIRIEEDYTVIGEIPIIIADRDFVSEEIELNQQNTNIRTVPDPQKTAESEQLWAIINRTGAEIFTEGPFIPPVDSPRRTSFYGDRRVYRYVSGTTDTAIHAGIDYGVPTGTPVRAAAAGRVVLARFRIATGNSVIIEHLPGVYSIYYHMDRIEAAEGDPVHPGDLLGESGATGLATGPHLHWEIRVAGENADPDVFVSRPILDKGAILSKLER